MQRQNFFGRELAVPVAANGDFVINAVDNLSGGDDLIGLRSRGRTDRPFVVVERLRRQAEMRYHAKERELQNRIEQTRQKLNELQRSDEAGGGTIVSSEQQRLVDKLRHDLLDLRKQLRDVRAALREEIDSLEAWVKFANIGFVPIVVGMTAMTTGVGRRLRLRRRHPYASARARER